MSEALRRCIAAWSSAPLDIDIPTSLVYGPGTLETDEGTERDQR